MKCSQCGCDVAAAWRFCPSCGSGQADAVGTTVTMPAIEGAPASAPADTAETGLSRPAIDLDSEATDLGRPAIDAADPDATGFGQPAIDLDPDATSLGRPAVELDLDATGFSQPAIADDSDLTGVARPIPFDADATMVGAPPVDADATMLGAAPVRPATPTPRPGRPPTGTTPPRRPPTGTTPRVRRPTSSGLGSAGGSAGGAPGATGPLEVGESFGPRYHIIRMLGIGGMGAVYQAWDSELEVALALKVIRPDATNDPEAAAEIERRFKRELLLARQVTHPNVVRIHDLGEIDGIKYITMPYVEGKDLSDILAETTTLPVPRTLAIAKQVASGLVAAHEAGVVHRDLKPANIMIDAEDRALIMDFGIARAAGGAADAGKGGAAALASAAGDAGATRVGTIVGTLDYMAPEQARGVAVDQRADIYAFGLILYRMLVGKRLAEGATTAFEDLKVRMQAEPQKLREIDETIPEHVESIISRCLQPDADARFQTTVEMLHALERLDENGIPLPEPPPIWKSRRFWGVAASIMTLLVGGTWWLAQFIAVPQVEVKKDPVSVLIADFANATGDQAFTGVLEQSLGVGVEAASFITAYDRRGALRVAGQLNAGKVLDDNVSRLVAQREGVKVVLAGTIAQDGSGYKLSVRGVNPADGKDILTTEARARNKDDVLNAVGRLANDVRKSLGDTKTAKTPAANEMLSAASLDAVSEYIKGQELTRQTRDEEAIPFFKRATELDPNFGRAYSAWGTAAFKLGRQEEAEAQYKKALSLLDRMTERERYRTLGVYFLAGSQNYDKAIENFAALVERYPSDAAAYNNMAVAYTNKRDFAKASEMGRKALEIYPKNRLYRSNYALYAMYAGDFRTAANEANRLLTDDPKYFVAYLPMAMAALARGDTAAARGFYEKMAAVELPRAVSLANIGLADIAIAEGRTKEALDILTKGIASDEAAKADASATVKRMAMAEAYELERPERGRTCRPRGRRSPEDRAHPRPRRAASSPLPASSATWTMSPRCSPTSSSPRSGPTAASWTRWTTWRASATWTRWIR